MNTEQRNSLIRITMLILASTGVLNKFPGDNAVIQEAIGFLLGFISIVWSIFEKRESAKVAKAVVTINQAVDAGTAAIVPVADGHEILHTPYVPSQQTP